MTIPYLPSVRNALPSPRPHRKRPPQLPSLLALRQEAETARTILLDTAAEVQRLAEILAELETLNLPVQLARLHRRHLWPLLQGAEVQAMVQTERLVLVLEILLTLLREQG